MLSTREAASVGVRPAIRTEMLNAAASAQGDDGYAPQWAGQAAPLGRALPAAELVEALAQETRAAIADLQQRL